MSSYLINSELETEQLAKKIANHSPTNERLVIFLSGQLGTGKTTFTRFFLKTLGYNGLVKSPTYTIFESYQVSDYHIFHLDLYRLNTPDEIHELGIVDEFDQKAIWLIEWPEHGLPFLPTPDIICIFSLVEFIRQVELKSKTAIGHDLLKKMKNS